MKTANRSNALLVELLIVVMFFMLSSTVLLQVFLTARSQSERAGNMTLALSDAQGVADRLYAAGDADAALAVLREMGFDFNAAGDSSLNRGDYTLLVRRDTEDREAGLMHRYTVSACQGEDLLFTLPVARYKEGRP